MMDRGNHSAYSPTSTSSNSLNQPTKRDPPPALPNPHSASRLSSSSSMATGPPDAASFLLRGGGMSGAGLGSPYRFLGASGGTTAHTGGAPPDHSLPQHPRAAYWQTLVDLAQTREWGGGAGAGGGGGGAQQQQPQPQRSTSAIMSEALAAAYGAGAAGGDSAPGSSDLHQHHHPLLGAVGNHDYQQRLAATLSNLGYGGGGGNAPPTSQQALQSNESLLLAMEVLKQQQQQDGPISSSSSSSANAFLAQQSQGGPSRNDVLEALQRLEQQQQQPQQSTNAASVISEAHAALRNSAPSASGTGALLGRAALKEALEASATMDYATGSSGGGALASDRALALEIYRQQQQLQQLNQQQHQQQHNDQSRAGLLASARGGATNSDVLQTLRLLGQQQQQQQQQQAAGLRDIPDVAASSSSSLDFGASAGGMSSLERSLALEFLQQKQQQQHQLQQLQLQEQSRSMASASALAAQRARLLGGGGGGLGPTAANGSDLYAALQLMGQSRVASGGSSSTADALAAALDGGRLAQVRRVDPAHAVASSSMVRSSGSASHNHRAASERASLDLSLCKTSSDTVRVLKVLGSTIRSKDDPFVDVDALPDLKHPYSEYKAPICGDLLFPDKLHILLEDAEREGFADVVSWLPHRRAFRVHNKARFLSDVMPRHFKGKGVWSSFRRQLNLYGFARTKKGIDAGSYYHELFLQGRKELSQFMFRVGRPRPGLDRRASSKLVEGDDPDFYSLPTLRERTVPTASESATATASSGGGAAASAVAKASTSQPSAGAVAARVASSDHDDDHDDDHEDDDDDDSC